MSTFRNECITPAQAGCDWVLTAFDRCLPLVVCIAMPWRASKADSASPTELERYGASLDRLRCSLVRQNLQGLCDVAYSLPRRITASQPGI